MKTPRAHAELAKLYYSDKEMQCWEWDKVMRAWRIAPLPLFLSGTTYHVGKEAPTEPPQAMCELAGVEFPMPKQEPLKDGDEYYAACTNDIERPCFAYWGDSPAYDKNRLEGGVIHLTWGAAKKHSQALVAATKQAVEKAKEQIK